MADVTASSPASVPDLMVLRIRKAVAATSLRARLIAVVMLLDIVAALVTSTVIVATGRSATAVEVDASMRLAGELVNEAARLLQDSPEPLILEGLRLQFGTMRHVRVFVVGGEAAAPADQASATEHPTAPRWFSALIRPKLQVQNVPLLVHNRRIGDVRIAAEPEDEIGEAWAYAKAMLLTGVILNVLILGSLLLVFGRLLSPLTALAAGLADFEERNYAVRLSIPSLPELAAIARHFNRAAAAIARERDAIRSLNRKLVTAQDDERRRTALELHDEMGPCLFALDACTSAMTPPGPADRDDVAARAAQATALVRELKLINRRVLARLRPPSLGRVPLADCLARLVDELAAASACDIRRDIGPLAPSYGATADLTLYRALQEGVCNALRHASASRIEVTAGEAEDPAEDSARRIILSVRDNGRGLAPHVGSGLGLAGMRERVEALAGRFDLAAASTGTVLRVALPIEGGTVSVVPGRAALTP